MTEIIESCARPILINSSKGPGFNILILAVISGLMMLFGRQIWKKWQRHKKRKELIDVTNQMFQHLGDYLETVADDEVVASVLQMIGTCLDNQLLSIPQIEEMLTLAESGEESASCGKAILAYFAQSMMSNDNGAASWFQLSEDGKQIMNTIQQMVKPTV